jgi:hypothetical protein
MVTFLANSVGLRENAWEGQVVPTLLSIARSPLSFEQIRDDAAHASDLAHGQFEVERLEAISMRDLGELVACVKERSTQLDQHGLLSVLYTARLLWRRDTVAKAFISAFATVPWWKAATASVPDRRWADPASLARWTYDATRTGDMA